MAVRAPDIALGYFGGDTRPSHSPRRTADTKGFVAPMVKLKHNRIALTAIHARVAG